MTSEYIIFCGGFDLVSFVNYVLYEDLRLATEWVPYPQACRMSHLSEYFRQLHHNKVTM